MADSAVEGFSDGIRRQPPHVQREVRRFQKFTINKLEENFITNKKDSLRESVISSDLKAIEERARQRRNGYRLGFMVGVLRDYGVQLESHQIPANDSEFDAFMNGLSAESRVVRQQRRVQTPLDKYKNYLFEEDPFVSQFEASAAQDELMYHKGLSLWIKRLGLGVQTWQIRHPSALEAFKVAYLGGVMPEYEQRDEMPRLDLKPKKTYGSEDLLMLNVKTSKETPLEDLLKREPTDADWGRDGYRLGKAARVAQLGSKSEQ